MRIHAHGSFCGYQSTQMMLTVFLNIVSANVWNRGKAANKRCQRVMKLNPRKRLKTWKQWKTQLPKERKQGKWNENEENKKAKKHLRVPPKSATSASRLYTGASRATCSNFVFINIRKNNIDNNDINNNNRKACHLLNFYTDEITTSIQHHCY